MNLCVQLLRIWCVFVYARMRRVAICVSRCRFSTFAGMCYAVNVIYTTYIVLHTHILYLTK